MQQPLMEIRNIAKTYGEGEHAVVALEDISLTVQKGELIAVVGPSGCGKTTLLKIIAGLMGATKGEVVFQGKPIVAPPDELAVVFQDYANSLMPWMTVGENIALPLRRKLSKQERERKVETSAEAVGLGGFLNKYPWQLSGGMQQRAAIARALAYEPAVLLMDEPFASVDAQTRSSLEDLTLQIRREFDMSILFVTHDIDESVYMSDRLVVLTSRPTTVQKELSVPLPYPRDQIETKQLHEFAELRASVHSYLREGHALTQEEAEVD